MKKPTFDEFCSSNNEWFKDVVPLRDKILPDQPIDSKDESGIIVRVVVDGRRVDIVHRITGG